MPGAQLTYLVAVTNNSSSLTALHVQMVDVLPGAVAFGSANTTKGTCSYSGGTVTCQLGDLAPQESVTVTILVTVDLDATGTFEDRATVSGDFMDIDPTNNVDVEQTVVSGVKGDEPDLSITITDAPDPVVPGADLNYINVISNIGTLPASDVTVVDTLPAEVTYVSASPTQGACTSSAGQVTCSLGALAAGASARVNIVTTVSPSASGVLLNLATASMTETDPNMSNNTDSEGTLVASSKDSVDLQLTMVDAPDPALPGEILEYVTVVSNVGGLPASGVVMTDTLPVEAAFISAVSTQGTCNLSGGEVICGIGALGAGASARVTIRLRINSTFQGVMTNEAVVDGNEVEIITTNNYDNEGTQVIAATDLAVEIDSTPNPVKHTKNLTYSLTVQNNGPSNATGVVLTDELPVGAVYVSAVTSQGTCVHSAGMLTCSLGSMPVGGTPVTLAVVVYLPEDLIGTYSSKAEVHGNEYDPCAINDEAVENTLVRGLYFMPIIRNSIQCPFCSQLDE
jgi:uncharacterized repeat protein (TIGR01451 family)